MSETKEKKKEVGEIMQKWLFRMNMIVIDIRVFLTVIASVCNSGYSHFYTAFL